MTSRLDKQIEFIIEIDKVKRVFRRTYLTNQTDRENDAEHSWHVALMAVLLGEYAADPDVDLLRVVKMLLVHDLVEIDAGDTLCYDVEGNRTKGERERAAADRIFNILPADQAAEVRALWDEFEARQSPDARFAASLDRLQPMLHNYYTAGRAWREHGITADRVLERNRHMAEGAPTLWEYAEKMVHRAVNEGYLAPAPEDET